MGSTSVLIINFFLRRSLCPPAKIYTPHTKEAKFMPIFFHPTLISLGIPSFVRFDVPGPLLRIPFSLSLIKTIFFSSYVPLCVSNSDPLL